MGGMPPPPPGGGPGGPPMGGPGGNGEGGMMPPPPGGGPGGSGGGGDLVYIDDSTESYNTIFGNAISKYADAEDFAKVIRAIKYLNKENVTNEELEKYWNVDAALRYLAVHTFMVNSDSYTGGMKQNFYLAEQDGRITILPWDYNLSFGSMGGPPPGGPGGMPNEGNTDSSKGQTTNNETTETINHAIDTPVIGVDMDSRPLISVLLSRDEYKEKYHYYLDELTKYAFANGTITDAVSGEEVDNVSLKMRFSWNNKDGRVLHTTSTNENGYYEISFVPGFYTIEYSKDGYITGYKNIIIGIVDYEAQNAVISPEMPDDGNFRIVLSWSNKPKDLDSHLTGPTTDGDRFHLYYKYANTSNRNANSDYYQLDLDNTDIVSRPNIPETTTIVTQLDGVYRYSVHDYTNRGNGDSDAMSQSNATVNVYKGSVLVATYHAPPNVKGSIWTVFELSGDEIKPINKIGNGLEDDVSKF